MEKIRYGIIGCGSMGREHIENIRAMGGAVVTAVSDPDAKSREQAAALLDGTAHVFEHHSELLGGNFCDAVVVASPNFTHIQVMRDALATDLHILCEKPLVTAVADGVELIERAKNRNGIVWVAQEYRYMPPVAEMIRIAHEGGVGRLHQVAIREHREPFYPKVGDWNRFSANTGGTLVEKCCHYFNLMDFILKEKPLRVFASGGQRVNHLDESYNGKTPDILDSAYVIVEYPSGARASLDLCMFAENSIDNEHVTIVGAEGKGPAVGHVQGCVRAPDPRHQHQIPRPAFRCQLHRAPEVCARGAPWAAVGDSARGGPACGGHRPGRAQEHRPRACGCVVRGLASGVVSRVAVGCMRHWPSADCIA
jgi:myo-inositol 2-dehydrogenase / D-chiro-inositol 1-dehydrogenase